MPTTATTTCTGPALDGGTDLTAWRVRIAATTSCADEAREPDADRTSLFASVRAAVQPCDMNPKFFGDSYDLVKRFLCAELHVVGYCVTVDPMFTGHGTVGKKASFI